jgi:N-acetylglucosaminyldiphosphoundecaprenol N-acetyl-beta-D-mannosaminyltransferase
VSNSLPKCRVLGIDLSVGSFDDHIARMAAIAAERQSSYACCVNAHMTVEASRDPDFRALVNGADFATADGMPLTKALKWLCDQSQERVAGNDLMPALLHAAEKQKLSVYLYGGQEEVLHLICKRVREELPNLKIAGCESPPFRALSEDEMSAAAERINHCGANFVLVSLGCPKQERWMAAMHGRIQSLMLGVGGAFLLYAGKDSRAPAWMRKLCLEWVYRLALEPRRLWKRYLVTNSIFLGMFVNSWLKKRILRKTANSS